MADMSRRGRPTTHRGADRGTTSRHSRAARVVACMGLALAVTVFAPSAVDAEGPLPGGWYPANPAIVTFQDEGQSTYSGFVERWCRKFVYAVVPPDKALYPAWHDGPLAQFQLKDGSDRVVLYEGTLRPGGLGPGNPHPDLPFSAYRGHSGAQQYPDFGGNVGVRIGYFGEEWRDYIAPSVEDEPNSCADMESQIEEQIADYHRTVTWVTSDPPEDQPPVAGFTYEVLDTDPLSVRFTNTSTDPDGDPITSAWDFGDGETSTDRSPTHTYARPGVYEVRLEVTADEEVSAYSTQVDLGGLVVNSAGDAPAQDPAEGCATGATVGDQPECTLRAAIETANHEQGGTITFAIDGGGVPSIDMATDLPELTAPAAEIDGTSQEGGWVKVTGGGRTGSSLLTLAGAGQRVTGLVLDQVGRGLSVTADEVTVEGNVVGADPTGATAGEVLDGIVVEGARATVRGNLVAAEVAISVLGADAIIAENLIGVSRAGGASGEPGVGIIVAGRDGTVEDNTVRATIAGVVMVHATERSAAGGSVTGNRIGVNEAGAVFADQGEGVRVDGAPEVTVAGNRIAAGQHSGVSVTGTPQVGEVEGPGGTPQLQFVTFDSSDRVVGSATGAQVTVSGNTIGARALGAAGSEGAPRHGVVVWEGAEEVTITDNTIAGQAGEAIHLAGGRGHVVTSNTIGSSTGGAEAPVPIGILAERTPGVQLGRAEAGNAVLATETGISLEGEGSDGTVAGNTVRSSGTAEGSHGIAVAAGTGAVTVTANTVTGFALGVGVQSSTAEVTGNAVAGSDVGIQVEPAAATVTGNVVTGTETTALAVGGRDAEVELNVIGRTTAGGPDVGNAGDGIVIGGTGAEVSRNVVAASGGDAIVVSASGGAELRGNRILATAGTPIRTASGPEPPDLAAAFRTTYQGAVRTALVVRGLPSEAGVVEVFANADCADGEAEKVLEVLASKDAGSTYRIVLLKDRPLDDHFTVTFTAGGRTSGLSPCTSISPFADADGDGSHDALDSLLGSEGDPTTAMVLTDEEQLLALSLASFDEATGVGGGRFDGVGVVDGPDERPAGVSLPYGLIGFTIVGLAPGGTTEVSLVVIEGDPLTLDHSYWKYGPPTSDAAPTWYDFGYDEATGTGARLGDPILDVGRPFVLTFTDGARGDTDGGANGSIRDPGGPAVSAGAPMTPAPTVPEAPGPPRPPAEVGAPGPESTDARGTDAVGPSGGGLSRTGADLGGLAVLGVVLVVCGAMVANGRRRAQGGLPSRS